MRTRTETLYCCEYCGMEFADQGDCEMHEQTHIKDYSAASDEEVTKMLKDLAENCWSWHVGQEILGIPYENFVSLMRTAAERIGCEEKENEHTRD